MSTLSKETRITLAIEAICTIKKMSIRQAIKIYDLFESSFYDQMKGIIPLAERRNGRCRLIPTEEKTFFQYILNLDSQRFALRIDNVEDMANTFFTTYSTKHIDIR